MKLTIECPKARYGEGMVIYCDRDDQPCGHQYFKSCKGWFALTDGAKSCPMREEREHGQRDAAAARGGDAV